MDSYPLEETTPQDALDPLSQLEPSPIESPVLLPSVDNLADENLQDLHDLPEDSTTTPLDQSTASVSSTTVSSPTSTLGLSGTSHGAIYYLTRIQRYSSYLIPVFTSIHLTTTSLIPLLSRSVPASESYLLQAREIYQTPLSEPHLVVLPIAAHVASGLAIRLIRRARNLRRYYGVPPTARKPVPSGPRIWPPVSGIAVSGYVFTAALAAHAAVNRVLPLLVEGHSADVGLAFVGHGFARHPALAWSAYAVLLVAGCGHMVWGAAKWAGMAPVGLGLRGALGYAPPAEWVDDTTLVRRRRRRVWWAIQGAAAAFAAVWAAGGLGVVARGGLVEGWVGKIYDGLYDAVPFL
ncbi:DUF1691-domain-containing protein [Sodiomyces alkalinus F11]|uniref:DUF1691-domain-containing protein n=1 Tax=Sodiomyces alkalinus (strain CBS 110278 / VKM F-3762 / F11) TaxID=1314773 RepID=A0A3N2Q480_SODAK|nr:DUF1691-domain-containing protein [Sodiomyces alkalinus F11]ROT41591.1 DUF1691-domain-containing protein [Sodiomyces alkalinus F11]